MKKYLVLKSTNLTENSFSLSLTRGEVRDDLESKFTAPYLKWHCDEKFLSIYTDKVAEDDNEKLDTDNSTENPDKPDLKEDETFTDLGSENPDLVDETDEIEETEDTDLEDEEIEDFPDFDSMTMAEVKAYAIENNVDIEGLKKKSDIIDAIFDELSDIEEA